MASRSYGWGDTAWELFHRLTREEAGKYLRDRARQKFTVIQAALKLQPRRNSPLTSGYGHDWVLIIDDASKSFPHRS
jgi:hypothetical protein